MVLQKRLDYVFNRYQVPRATRSPRTRIPFRKKVDDNQMWAFDLLATVAGKLLSERENIPNSTGSLAGKQKCANGKYSVTKEQLAEDNPERIKLCDEGSCGNVFVPEVVSHAQNDACSRLASLVTTSDCSDKFGSTAKLVNDEGKIEHGNSAAKVDMESYSKCLSFGSKLDDKNKNIKIEPAMIENEAISVRADILCFGDVKPPAHGSFPDSRDNVKLVSRDDDENSCGCIQSSTPNKANKPPPRIGDRRIRRLLTSKYWKVGPKLKDEERFSTGSETKYVYQSRVNCHKRQRSLRDYPIKKRRLYERSLMESVDGVDVTSGSAGKGSSGDDSHEEIWASALAAGQQTSFQPNNSQVKLKIKSFRVPELFIEIPETETVGSLKRIVMEAVTAMLSNGLGVGVLLQGKKIRDDNKTLAQIRISDNNKMDTLSFSLEPPNSSQVPPPSCPQDQSFLLPCITPPSLTRCPQKGNSDVLTHLPLPNFGNISEHDSATSPPDISSVDKSLTDSSGAFVAVPDMNVEALAVVSMRKSKRLDVSQRRIRRPFSVSEVEALVQAVEKLGTGRWRDVKLRAFDNAKHRTYVDLKDKWKTLVHTARISPQQRRGEPVPQELLERVLAAHAFWSQQQAKQQIKQHSASCLLL